MYFHYLYIFYKKNVLYQIGGMRWDAITSYFFQWNIQNKIIVLTRIYKGTDLSFPCSVQIMDGYYLRTWTWNKWSLIGRCLTTHLMITENDEALQISVQLFTAPCHICFIVYKPGVWFRQVIYYNQDLHLVIQKYFLICSSCIIWLIVLIDLFKCNHTWKEN